MKVDLLRPRLADCFSVGLALAWLVSACAHQPETETANPQEAWVLHGTGVAELVPGAPIPESVYAREGQELR